LKKVPLKLSTVVIDELSGIFADLQHGANVAFGHGVLLEAVLVAALFLADLAVPAKTLQAFGFHFIRDIFRAADLCFTHDGGSPVVAR
jgi:hypothetical protein